VLFDIDGTLLSATEISRKALAWSLKATFGTAGPIATHDFSGKTDPQIMRELMHSAGVSEAAVQAGLAPALEHYRKRLVTHLKAKDVRAKEGVLALLRGLSSETLGLLTGNLEECARAKLEPLGLNSFFPFGAFGSDDEDRERLPKIALERAERLTGFSFFGKSIVIVGDSVHDVRCGRSLGVRSVAVATGLTSWERLEQESPDALLSDLSDTRASLTAIAGV
jgi:phosphoglycolate phosphatase